MLELVKEGVTTLRPPPYQTRVNSDCVCALYIKWLLRWQPMVILEVEGVLEDQLILKVIKVVHGGASFSNAAHGGQHTKFINCYLKKKDEVDTPWQLTLREKAMLIFRTLGLPEAIVVGYDESLMKCFRIVVPENFDVDKYLPTTEIEVRKGLSVLPLKEWKKDIQIEVS